MDGHLERRLVELDNEGLLALLGRLRADRRHVEPIAQVRDEIVRRNVGLVKSIAQEFRNAGEPLEDLVQAGYIGLLNAVANFDLARGTRFSTYATYLIKGEIRHYIRDRHAMVRIPQWVQAMNRRVKGEEEAFFQAKGRPPTLRELADRVGLTEGALVELLRGREAMTYVSIDEERRAQDPNPSPPEILHLATPEDGGFPFDLRVRILITIERLEKMEREIVEGLFYEGRSQDEVGRSLGISQRQVSRLRGQILAKVRQDLVGPGEGERAE